MLIKAEQKYIRISPRKMRLVVNAIKNLSPGQAVEQLKFVNKSAAIPLLKTIKQAIANGVNNFKLNKEDLKFAKIEILKGATYKRWQPVSRGRAHSILKRTSHIRVVLKTKNQKPKIKNKKRS